MDILTLSLAVKKALKELGVEDTTKSTIDPKYLPGVCLPVVELETVLQTGKTMDLSEADSTALTKASEAGLPCSIIFKWNSPTGTLQAGAVFVRAEMGGSISYQLVSGSVFVHIIHADHAWIATAYVEEVNG